MSCLLQEVVVGSYRHEYAGTFDLIGELPDGRRILFDYKTSSSIKETVALQLAAYRWADSYLAGPDVELPVREMGIDDTMAVHIRADGYDVYPLETGQDVFNTILNMLAVARAYPQSESWVGSPVAPPKAVAA